MSDLPTSSSPSYDSPEHMTIGFCVQVCLGAASDPENIPEFLGVMVSLILENSFATTIINTIRLYLILFFITARITL